MKRPKNLIVYGDSSFAQMVAHYFTTDSANRVVAYCVDAKYKTMDQIGDVPVIAFEEILNIFSPETHSIFAAIGYKSVRTHKILYEKVAKAGFPVASYISSRAVVDSSCHIGENVLILPGSVIEPYVTVEDNCFINSAATVCHHAHIKAHTILASGSLVGGYTTIGEASLIGFNATVVELLDIADETLLGAGSVLLQDSKSHTMYVGTPAREARTHEDTGIMMLPKKLISKG